MQVVHSRDHEGMITCDGFLCVPEIICLFHSGYFDYRGAFQTVTAV